MHLIHYFYRSTIIMQQKYTNGCDILKEHTLMQFNGEVYDDFSTKYDHFLSSYEAKV